MDADLIRTRAEAHGKATVAGDLKAAGSDLDPAAYGAAGEVMKKMPEDLSGSEVADVRSEGGQTMVTIRYAGASGSVDVESVWAEREGEPKIVDLKVL